MLKCTLLLQVTSVDSLQPQIGGSHLSEIVFLEYPDRCIVSVVVVTVKAVKNVKKPTTCSN